MTGERTQVHDIYLLPSVVSSCRIKNNFFLENEYWNANDHSDKIMRNQPVIYFMNAVYMGPRREFLFRIEYTRKSHKALFSGNWACLGCGIAVIQLEAVWTHKRG